MCGRYVLVQKVDIIEKRFNVVASADLVWEPNYNIGPGTYAPIITSDRPHELQLFQFGLTPFWAKKPMYLFNARTEGDRNKENQTDYNGSKDIIIKPAFRKPIRSQRCLIIADAFIEGTSAEGLSKPYLVFLKDKVRPFAFAGIYDLWQNPITNDIVESFSIITTVTNSLLQKLPHHRSPVILPQHLEAKWLNSSIPLSDVTKMLQPYDGSLMNAYPISDRIKNPKENDKSLIARLGPNIHPSYEVQASTSIQLEGMGHRKTLQ